MTKLIDHSIESAQSDGGRLRAPVVSLKVRKNGKQARRMDEFVRTTTPPHVGDEVVRIINECDPIGFLADIVNGKAIQCHVVDEDGKVISFYETPDLKKRVEVAKFLAERYMPKVAVTKHAHLHKIHEEQGQPDHRQSFEQIVTHAAQASDSED